MLAAGLLFGCPASTGNNDWNPDRIPMACIHFRDLAVPCPLSGGAAWNSRTRKRRSARAPKPASAASRASATTASASVRETAIAFGTTVFSSRPGSAARGRSPPEDGPHGLLVARGARSGLSGRVLGYATSNLSRPKTAYGTSAERRTSESASPARPAPAAAASARCRTRRSSRRWRARTGRVPPPRVRRRGPAQRGVRPAPRLHARFGSRHAGTYREVGREFGRHRDVARYDRPPRPAPGLGPAA